MIAPSERTIDATVAAHVGRRYTAAVARVEVAGRCVFERAYGTLDDSRNARATQVRTAFDLASITKVFVANAALELVERGILDLDAPLVALVPEWRGTTHATITLASILAHTAGFASGADYRTLFDEDVARFAASRELVAPPGERVVYSDLGFIVLGTILARAHVSDVPAGARALATVVRASTAALGCEGTTFRSRNDDPEVIAATEEDAWRGRVRGAVHDEKAYLMNGVAGHAGLFGTAHDVARLADRYLAAEVGRRARARPLEGSLARAAISERGADAVLRRGYGWALKTSDANSCGVAMARETFGHTGFTGTCVWADPTRDLCVVLLTNAVYYGRNDLRDVRAAVCDAAVAEFG